MLIFLFALAAVTLSSDKPTQTKYFTSFDGTRIAFTDEGRGMPVLLLHGFINTRASWDNTALKQTLIDSGFRVITPDLRGNGESDKPHAPEAYANDAEVKDMISLADHLHLKKYDAVGYSRGAIVLAKLLTKDKRIKKAVLGGMGADFTNPNWDRKLMFAEAFGGKADQYPQAAGAVAYAKSVGADTLVLSLLQKYQPVTSPAELGRIRIPVLVIAGDQDTDNGRPQDLVALLRKGALTIVKGNHNSASKTTAFAEAVLSFLQTNASK